MKKLRKLSLQQLDKVELGKDRKGCCWVAGLVNVDALLAPLMEELLVKLVIEQPTKL